MPILTPGRRPAYPPIGKLRVATGGGKKSGFVSLNLTPMVDMFTILVIFLIQMFSADNVSIAKDINVPRAVNSLKLEKPGTQVTISRDEDPTTEGWQGRVIVEQTTVPESEMGAPTDVLMPGVGDRLKKVREADEDKLKRIGTPRDMDKPYDGIVTVQADVTTDFKVIRRVLFSANDAGWAKIKFVTLPDAAKVSSVMAEAKAGE